MSRVGGILLALLLAAALAAGGLLQGLERTLLDAQFRWLQANTKSDADAKVVLIGFDEKTTDLLREPFTLWHVHLGELVQAVAAGGASILGLDVVLPDRSQDPVIPGIDRKLIAGILLARRSTPVVLAVTVDSGGHTRPIYSPLVTAAGPDALGYALLHIDEDGRVRRFDERIEAGGQSVQTLVGAMARRLGKPAQSGLIDYGRGGRISFIPMQQVLAWWANGDQAALLAAFRGKAVLFGGVLKYEDRHPVPVNLLDWDS